jgi:replicative superfamily II helicase
MLFRKYVLGTPESITSSFHTDEIETWFVRLLAQFSRVLQEDAVKLLSCTFAGYLKNKMSPGWQEHIRVSLEKFLLKMVELKLVEQEDGYVQLTLLGRACGRSHLKFRSAMRLVELLRSLSATSFTAMGIIAVIQGLDEMDQQARISIFRKGSKEDIWPHNASRLFGREVILLLQNHVPKDIYDYYARSKKALLLYDWISGMSVHDLESKYTLVDNSFCRLTYGHLINIANMTRFHLKSASEIASLILLGNQSIGDEIDRLLIRLEIGLPEELLGLLELPIKLDRGHYLALSNAGIRNKEQFWKAPPDTLESIIGKRLIGQLSKYRQAIN